MQQLSLQVVFSEWRTGQLLQLVLQSGLVVSISLNRLGGLARIHLDRALVCATTLLHWTVLDWLGGPAAGSPH